MKRTLLITAALLTLAVSQPVVAEDDDEATRGLTICSDETALTYVKQLYDEVLDKKLMKLPKEKAAVAAFRDDITYEGMDRATRKIICGVTVDITFLGQRKTDPAIERHQRVLFTVQPTSEEGRFWFRLVE